MVCWHALALAQLDLLHGLGGKHLVEEDAEVGRDVVVGPRLALRDAAAVA